MKHTPRNLPRSRLGKETENLPDDPYQRKTKPDGPAVCPDCGAVFKRGRWAWGEADDGAQQALCTACLRIREKMPAGYVHLSGSFLLAHRQELLSLVKNEEALEQRQHPMQRVMEMKIGDDGVQVETTDVHLARRLGEAVHDAYQGTLEIRQAPHEYKVQVDWRRDA